MEDIAIKNISGKIKNLNDMVKKFIDDVENWLDETDPEREVGVHEQTKNRGCFKGTC